MNSRILKYKFGPFWIKVRVTLTPLTQADNAGAAVAVLRLERPNICGGCVDLPIGRHGFPMTLLQRSVNDRRKLRLTIRYGAAGKSIRLQAPTVEVYLDWIADLRYVFEIKKPHQTARAKRNRNDTASTDDLSDDAGSAKTSSNRNADNQVPEDTPSLPPAAGPVYIAVDATQMAPVNATEVASKDTTEVASEDATKVASTDATEVASTDATEVASTDATEVVSTDATEVASTDATEADVAVGTTQDASAGQQNVFCAARDRSGATSFTVFCPPRPAQLGRPRRPERVFELSSADWARWLARDICNGGCLPEVFRLTVDGCKRLRLSEILAIAQPFFD